MHLVIRQFGKNLARVNRPDTARAMTDNDATLVAPTVERLEAAGKLQMGYYDILLFNGTKELDGKIAIA